MSQLNQLEQEKLTLAQNHLANRLDGPFDVDKFQQGSNGELYIVFECGFTLQIHEKEIHCQAIEALTSKIEEITHG